MRFMISKLAHDMIKILLTTRGLSIDSLIFEAVLNDLERRGHIPQILNTPNLITPHHKMTFLFYNSDVINENDRRNQNNNTNYLRI